MRMNYQLYRVFNLSQVETSLSSQPHLNLRDSEMTSLETAER